MALLNWKLEKVKIVPKNSPKGKKGDKENKVKTREFIHLLPGYNEVDNEDWEQIKDNCKPRLLDNNLVLLTKMEGDKEIIVSFSNIAKDNPDKAVEIILQTYNVSLLEKWKSETSRDELRSAIFNQIDAIKNYKGSVRGKRIK